MGRLGIIAGYLVLHPLACRALARLHPFWRTERGIFAAHALAYILALTAAGLAGWDAAWLVAAAGLLGLYSLSFLELWSLTEGSYSLALLARVRDLGPGATPAALASLAAVGRGKGRQRTANLAGLGLVERAAAGTAPRLTALGRACARLLLGLRLVTNGRTLNP